MPSLLAFATPLAMLLPFLGQSSELVAGSALIKESVSAPAEQEPSALTTAHKGVALPARYPTQPVATVTPLDTFRQGQVTRQIRIEQRVIVRISPQRSRNSNELLAQLPQRSLNTQYEERKMEKCLPVGGIAGVQTGSGSRLLLFLRDTRIISVNLEKACRARDFYSGFYVEQNKDGQLCVDRDKLQSRSGVKCEVERMRHLVAIEN